MSNLKEQLILGIVNEPQVVATAFDVLKNAGLPANPKVIIQDLRLDRYTCLIRGVDPRQQSLLTIWQASDEEIMTGLEAGIVDLGVFSAYFSLVAGRKLPLRLQDAPRLRGISSFEQRIATKLFRSARALSIASAIRTVRTPESGAASSFLEARTF